MPTKTTCTGNDKDGYEVELIYHGFFRSLFNLPEKKEVYRGDVTIWRNKNTGRRAGTGVEFYLADVVAQFKWDHPPKRAKLKSIILTPHEIQNNHTRQEWAEGLISQLPPHHEGRNAWLLNYGVREEAQGLRIVKGIAFLSLTQAAETNTPGVPK